MELVKTYSPSQFAKKIGTTNATFQKWEAHFSKLMPAPDSSGKHFYTDEHLPMWTRISTLVREQKMSLEEVTLQLEREVEFEKQKAKAAKKLKTIRDFLSKMLEDL